MAVLAEALTNTARHAEATHAWVRAWRRGTGWCSPSGTTDAACRRTSSASGLRNMQERAESLGGTCTVETPAPGGTVVTWSVPVR